MKLRAMAMPLGMNTPQPMVISHAWACQGAARSRGMVGGCARWWCAEQRWWFRSTHARRGTRWRQRHRGGSHSTHPPTHTCARADMKLAEPEVEVSVLPVLVKSTVVPLSLSCIRMAPLLQGIAERGVRASQQQATQHTRSARSRPHQPAPHANIPIATPPGSPHLLPTGPAAKMSAWVLVAPLLCASRRPAVVGAALLEAGTSRSKLPASWPPAAEACRLLTCSEPPGCTPDSTLEAR